MACSFLIKTPKEEKYQLFVFPNCDSAKPKDAAIHFYMETQEELVDVAYLSGLCLVEETYKITKTLDTGILKPKYDIELTHQNFKINPSLSNLIVEPE